MDRTFFPLTNAQKSIWVADHLYPGTSQNNLAATAVMNEPIDFSVMNEAYNLVVKNNDALRIRLINQNGTPKQYFKEYSYQTFDQLDFDYPGGEREYKNWEEKMNHKPFQLIDSDLFYFAMVNLGGGKSICYFNYHHIIVDAWGVVLVSRKIMKEYWHLKHGVQVDFEEEPSFVEHISDEQKYMSSRRHDQHKEFWQNVFGTIPEFISLNKRSLTSLGAKRKTFALSKTLSTQLQTFCKEHSVSNFSVFYALLAIYIYKISSKKDIVIGTPVLNRTGIREKNTIGMFMHNIPTRIIVDPTKDFVSFVSDSFRELRKYLKNQRYPYSSILKDFRERHQFSGTLMDIILNYHNATYDSMVSFEGTWNYSGAQTNSLSLSVSDRDAAGIPMMDYDYLLEVFQEKDIDDLHQGLCNLLSDALANPTKRLSELQILAEDELKRLVYGLNQTNVKYTPQTLSEMFEERVEKAPESIALVFGDHFLTFSELNTRANQLACYLQKMEIEKNQIVGLLVDRSFEMIIGILGILKAGCTYLPLDPNYPKERISYILNHSDTRLILTDRDDLTALPLDFGYEFRNISLSNRDIYNRAVTNLSSSTSPDDLAYVLYTSGSTGKPKGVTVHHKALCNFINSIASFFDLQGKTIVALTTMSFDIFFLETILPLILGMKVIIANEDEQAIPRLLFQLMNRHNIDVLQVTPSRMRLILNEEYGRECLKNLTYLLIGGEAFPPSLLADIHQVTQAKTYNMYGPTETTIWSTLKEISDSEKITVGRPIANTQVYILDDNLSPVPMGATGEIFIAGDGVTSGYLKNPELTQKYFLPDPFVSGSTMYRTGDLGRWLNNEEIECLGRYDSQVKIRGFRIELGEIEACLSQHPAVKESVVIMRTDGNARQHLCAYFTSDQRPDTEELKAHVLRYLPNYMLPAWFICLQQLPQTPNGKIDRLALPEPNEVLKNDSNKPYEAPRNDIESKMAVLWAEALEAELVGIDDNLFALGGDSLIILEIMSGALRYAWKLNAQDFYECPTIREISARIAGKKLLDKETSTDIYQPKFKIIPVCQTPSFDTGNLLLTGATGFLGIHLLKDLLTRTDKEIYCLVRGENPQVRLDDMITFYYNSFSKAFRNRIKVVPGDITLKHFGLNDLAYQELAGKVQTVIHSAGLTKHYGNYHDFMKVNVQGTCEVINFCLNYNKCLNHISTISISGNYFTDQNSPSGVFREDNFYVGQDYRNNVYVRSKFEAENQVFKAETNGLRANVFRVGILTGRSSDGRFQPNIEDNAFYRKIKALLLLQVIPESFLEQSIEMTPVDLCSQAIVKIVNANQNDGLIFHMFNHRRLNTNDLLNFLNGLNLKVKILGREKFNDYIIELSKTKQGKDVLSGIITDLVIDQGLSFDNVLSIDSSFTIDYLEKIGFAWLDIDRNYIAKIINHMQDVGFVELFGGRLSEVL